MKDESVPRTEDGELIENLSVVYAHWWAAHYAEGVRRTPDGPARVRQRQLLSACEKRLRQLGEL